MNNQIIQITLEEPFDLEAIAQLLPEDCQIEDRGQFFMFEDGEGKPTYRTIAIMLAVGITAEVAGGLITNAISGGYETPPEKIAIEHEWINVEKGEITKIIRKKTTITK